ncbi:MAG: prepilin-type N-terminal cleavage/methylation domain-containing protein [Kiritimatiellae bacterium]|nr:prepilin-type N-terminal cleavage/methylation domain-containing protein [Kiritimatiellia bacterium]
MVPNRRARRGQSLIEALVVIAIGCLICLGAFQISQLYAGRAVLSYTAAAAARARSVGFNDFMVYKVARAAAIPNAGRIVEPQIQRGGGLATLVRDPRPGRVQRVWSLALASDPTSPQAAVERSRIPLYLGATRWGDLPAILDYENWDDIHYVEGPGSDTLLMASAHQRYELTWPLVRTFYAGGRVNLRSGLEEEFIVRDKHYPLYLEE